MNVPTVDHPIPIGIAVQALPAEPGPCGGGSAPKDLVTVNQTDGTVSVLVNNGSLGSISFAPAVNLPVRQNTTSASNPSSIAAIDLDGDGDMDLAVVANDDADSQRIVRVLRNDFANSQLAFAPSTPQTAGTNPSAVVAADLDADLRADLVTINNTIGLLGRTPSGQVTVRLNSITGDMNCDGLVDLADIAPFVLALTNPSAYASAYPACQLSRADMNADTKQDGKDIQLFVKALVP